MGKVASFALIVATGAATGCNQADVTGFAVAECDHSVAGDNARLRSIEHEVKMLVAEQLGVPNEQVVLEDSLVDDLGADSLDCVELTMAVDETFKLGVSEEEIDWLTVGNIVSYVCARQSR